MGLAGNGPVNLGSAYGEIVIDVSRVERDINGQIARIEGGLGAAFSRIGGQLQGIGAQMTLALAPVTMFATRGLGAFMNFDAILTEIQARTGLTADEMERVQAVALEMGQQTAFSATQAADAMLQLISSGSSVEEAIGALPMVLDMAAAGGLDLGFAADALTDIMAQFGLEVQDVTPQIRELAQEAGVTRDMFNNFGADDWNVTDELRALSEATGLSMVELYNMRGAITEVSPELQALADSLGVTEETFANWGTDLFNMTPEFKALRDELGLTSEELYDLFAGAEMAFSGFEDARSVVDSLSAAAGSSSATMNDLVQAFTNGGPIASMFGLSVDETAAVLAVFAENGLKGAEAGTQLKSMLTNMTRDTDKVQGMWDELGISMYDFQGNVRPINDILLDLNTALDGTSEAYRINVIQTLAGSYGQLGLSALLSSDGIGDMQAQMAAAADSTTVAKAQLSSFRGVVNQLKSSVETFSIVVLGPLAEQYLIPMAVAVTELVNQLVAWLRVNPEIAATLGLIVGGLAILGPTLFILGTIISGVGSALTVMGTALAFLLSPIGLLIAALAALGVAYATNFMGFGDFVDDLVGRLGTALEAVGAFIEGLVEAFNTGGLEGVGDFIDQQIIQPIVAAFNAIDWGQAVSDLWNMFINALVAVAVWTVEDALPWVNDHILKPIGAAVKSVDWAQVGTDLWGYLVTGLNALADVGADIATWVNDKILAPLGTAIKDTDWAQVGRDLWGYYVTALQTEVETITAIAQWVNDKILAPLGTAISEVDWAQVGRDITGALIAALNFIDQATFDAAGWLLTNIVGPIARAILFTDWSGIATGAWNMIKQAFTLYLDAWAGASQWVVDNIYTPVWDGAAGIDWAAVPGEVWRLIKEAFNTVVEEAFDAGTWFTTNVTAPILAAITETNWYELASQLWELLKGAINTVIPDRLSIAIPKVDLGPLGSIGGTTVGVDLPNPFAAGGMFDASIRSMLVGERGPELMVNKGSGLVVSNDQLKTALNVLVSMMGGAKGMADLLGIGRGGLQPMPAEGLGGRGGAPQTSNAWTINVSVPAEVLRNEPGLGRNADMFGDMLLQRMRGKGGR